MARDGLLRAEDVIGILLNSFTGSTSPLKFILSLQIRQQAQRVKVQ